MPKFCTWKGKGVPNACSLSQMTGFDDVEDLWDGKRMQDTFPANVKMFMNPDRPKDTIIPDNVSNIPDLIVVSDQLKRFLEERRLPEVEYHPVTIMDHRKKPAPDPYFIVHPVGAIECVDESQSNFRRSPVNPDRYSRLKLCVLDEKRIPPERQLFRVKGIWGTVFMRSELGDALTAQGFTGFMLGDASKIGP